MAEKPAPKFYQISIKSFIILAALRRSVLRVCVVHLRVIASGQHSSFRRHVAAVASRWQHCVRIGGPRFEYQISCSRDQRVTARPTGRSQNSIPFQFYHRFNQVLEVEKIQVFDACFKLRLQARYVINYRAVSSRNRLVRDQDRNRKTCLRPRPRPAFFETLALILRPGKFKTKTETD